MKGPNNSQELRGEIQQLVQARESLQSNADVSGSMVKITKTLNNIKPLLSKQGEYIKNFLQNNETNDQGSKESQTRRYITRICDIILKEVNQLLGVAEEYFTLDSKTSWGKIRGQFQRNIQTQRQQIDKNNIVEFVFKVMNLKEKLMKEFMRSLLYRKCLLWKDLNIVNDGFVHSEKKRITKTIEDYITNKNYAPTRPLFSLPPFDTPGQWSLSKQEVQDSSITEFLKLLNAEIEESFQTIRNYSGLTAEQRDHQDIRRNDAQVQSLRDEIEQCHISFQALEKKYRQAVSKDEKLDIVEMKQKLKAAEEALEAKQIEMRQLKYSYRDYSRDMNSQKEKIKELEADLQKISVQEMKKLKEVELLQTSLSEEFTRLHKNMSSFGSMFEFESDGKRSLAQQIINLKDTIQKMAIILGRHKKDNINLKQEIKRLNLIIIELGLKLKER